MTIFSMDDLKTIEGGGGSAIGHVRYSTTGDSTLTNAQPFVVSAPGPGLCRGP